MAGSSGLHSRSDAQTRMAPDEHMLHQNQTEPADPKQAKHSHRFGGGGGNRRTGGATGAFDFLENDAEGGGVGGRAPPERFQSTSVQRPH